MQKSRQPESRQIESRQIDTLDEQKLGQYLTAHIDGFTGPITAEKFPGGQSNPTFKITTATGTYVLRRQPPGKLLKSAHAVDREYKVLQALNNTSVPVATTYHLCEDPSIIGSMFYVMEYCQGNIYWDAALPEVEKNTRTAMYGEMNRVLAELHSVDINAVGLSDFGKPGNYYQRQFTRWSEQYHLSLTKDIEAMDELMNWLEQHLPTDDGQLTIVHGDYRLDNIMFSPDNTKIIALLDWELSTLGHPMADLAYQCMHLRMSRDSIGKGLMGLDRADLGIPSEQQYLEEYCERRGIGPIDNWPFYLTFSFFRLAAIVQGVAKRAADGNASNKDAEKVGRLVQPLAEMALAVIDS